MKNQPSTEAMSLWASNKCEVCGGHGGGHQEKCPVKVAEMNKLFASNGGKARAKKLTPKQRSDSARKAVNARWEKCKVINR